MDIFETSRRLGHRAALWRRHDIYALDDNAAKIAADGVYRGHAAQRPLTSFSLYTTSGRLVSAFPARAL
jgi:hypothetical protein